MVIRNKVLLLLCTIGLLPAILTAWLDVKILHSLGEELTRRTSSAMAEQALATMNRVADEYASALNRESRRMRMLVRLQAHHAERLLASAPERGVPVIFDEAFDAGDAELDLVPFRVTGQSFSDQQRDVSVAVSWMHQVFRSSPGTSRQSVAGDAAALAPMSRFYRRLRDPADAVVKWHYVALENGLMVSYPGHGGYPESFDPRRRPWYVTQKNAPRFHWHQPHFDATTGTLVINATMPLFNHAGTFIGVTGVDVDLIASFDVLQLPAHLRAGSEVMQVAVMRPPDVKTARVVVLARKLGKVEPTDWEALPKLARFTLEDEGATRDITEAMLAGRNGYATVRERGEEQFVLYRSFGDEGGYLVLSVPVTRATSAALDAARHAQRTIEGHTSALLAVFSFAAALLAMVALLASRHFTQPLHQLGEAVRRLAAGDYSARVRIRTHDELQALGNAFNAMVPRLADHARVRESLTLAREIQQQLLPPGPPTVAGFELAGVSLYSDQTGGDYFDYLPLGEGGRQRFGVVVADVSGHGIGPALLMATTRALLHGAQGRDLGLAGLLGHVNGQLADDVSRGHFVTLYLLCLESGSPRIEWSSAGHDAAVLFEAGSRTFTELAADDIPLGIDHDWSYAEAGARELSPGDVVVIGTDGIWEAAGPDGRRYGKERVRAYVADHAAESAQAICNGLLEDLKQFRAGTKQADDVTAVVVKFTGLP